VYKSMVICFLQLLYNGACGASGCSLLDAVSLTAYNLVLTAVPSTLMALDSDASSGALLAAPARYRESAALAWFTPSSLRQIQRLHSKEWRCAARRTKYFHTNLNGSYIFPTPTDAPLAVFTAFFLAATAAVLRVCHELGKSMALPW
jgi:hypothetical protein